MVPMMLHWAIPHIKAGIPIISPIVSISLLVSDRASITRLLFRLLLLLDLGLGMCLKILYCTRLIAFLLPGSLLVTGSFRFAALVVLVVALCVLIL